jgi:hypothetical protein
MQGPTTGSTHGEVCSFAPHVLVLAQGYEKIGADEMGMSAFLHDNPVRNPVSAGFRPGKSLPD